MGRGNYSKYPAKAGVYKFTCTNNGKIYIGKSINMRIRFNGHKDIFRKTRKRKGTYFENALKKHGWDSFEIEILEIFENFDKFNDNDALLEREAFYIELFDSTNPKKGYNSCKYSTDRTGVPCSDETKERLRQVNLGKIHSDATRNKMRESQSKLTEQKRQRQLGVSPSEETKEKLRRANLGKILTDEHKKKIGLANTGRKLPKKIKEKVEKPKVEKLRSPRKDKGKARTPMSEETKRKLSEAKKGKPNNRLGVKHSAETKEKMSKARMGKIMSDETKEKLSQSKLGTILTEEHKEKIRQTFLMKRLSKLTEQENL